MPPMPRACLPLLILLPASVALAGCNNVTAPDRPFAREDPRLNVEGFPLAAAGAFSGLSLALEDAFALLGDSPPNYVTWARTLAKEDAAPDELRNAIFGLTRYDYGRKPPYTEVYAALAAEARDPLVRASAIRALNISRDESAVPLFVAGLGGESPLVRLESAKALGNVPDESAAGPLLALAQDAAADLDTRIAAVDALRHYDNADLKRSLAGLLESDEFSLAWQARRSLVTILGEDHGYDLDAWRRAIG